MEYSIAGICSQADPILTPCLPEWEPTETSQPSQCDSSSNAMTPTWTLATPTSPKRLRSSRMELHMDGHEATDEVNQDSNEVLGVLESEKGESIQEPASKKEKKGSPECRTTSSIDDEVECINPTQAKTSGKGKLVSKRKKNSIDIVLDEEHETIADVTELPEEELDDLPNVAPMRHNIDELPVEDTYHSGFSSSDDGEFQADMDEQVPPNYDAYKGCGQKYDDLYDDMECDVQFEPPQDVKMLEKGMVWPSMTEFRKFLANYCIKKRFEIYVEKVDKTRYDGRCKGNNKTCPWRIFVSKKKYDDQCKLSKLVDKHTCRGNILGRNVMADSTWVSYEIEKDIRENEMTFTPANIKNRIMNAHGIPISYFVGWKARAKALKRVYGSFEEGYKLVPEICRQVTLSNPGSVATCNRGNMSFKFTNMCLALKPMLDGFVAGYRPLIGLDGFHLKGKYGGVCLSVVALDSNNGLYPLGIFLCMSENTHNWTVFLKLLHPFLSKHREPLTFMSDSQKGLKKAEKGVFRGCMHRYCFRHLYKNFKKEHKGNQVELLSWGAAKAFRSSDYEKWMATIQGVVPEAYDWFIKHDPPTWARSFFDTVSKCEHITNNFSESFNSWIVDLRDKPFQRFVDQYLIKLMTLMYERRDTASRWDINGLVPRANRILEKLKTKIRKYRVLGCAPPLWSAINQTTGEKWMVHVEKKTCSCRVWDLTGIPCVHAVAVIDQLRLSYIDNCDDFHKVRTYFKAYEGHIVPLSHRSEWSEPNILY